MIKTVFILLFTILAIPLMGQNMVRDTVILNGIAIRAGDTIPVRFAHVHNESLRTASISDSSGYFSIHVSGNDSLVFSAIGYFSKLVILSNKISPDTFITIPMLERTYEIELVSVFGVRSYRDFRQKAVRMKIEKTKLDNLRDTLVQRSKNEAIKAHEEAKTQKMLARESISQIPIASIPIYSKKEKEQKKLKKIIEKEKIQHQVYDKFNKNIISQLTGLKEPRLTDFYVYLDFSTKFVLKSSDYEIRQAIRNKFELYLKENSKDGAMDSDIQ